jgi:putative ABC transport system permease protein
MNVISLSPLDLTIVASLVIALGAVGYALKLGFTGPLLTAALRTAIQLTLIGFVLKALFGHANIYWMALIALIMLSVASREILVRQKHRFKGIWAITMTSGPLFLSSFTVTIFALLIVINNDPWYSPQYAIPMLGMVLGNTMNGVALSLDRLTLSVWQQREAIEQRLMLGHYWQQSIHTIRIDSIRTGMMPILNAMATAGLVNLPGMMTGQILAGTPPIEAVKYQIMILFLIAAGTGFGIILTTIIASRRLFDDRHRLRTDYLQ